MVVLEGHNMLGVNSPNQYLQPDYLSPLPTTLDAKKSPLALLVQTCSQIGADTSGRKLNTSPPAGDTGKMPLKLCESSEKMGQKRKASTSSDSGHGSRDSNDSRPRSSGSTSSNCSSAKQPRLSPPVGGHTIVNGKVSPNNKYSSAHNNNNEDSHSHASKLRKLSGQSIASDISEKSRHHALSRGSPPSNSVIVPQGKTSSGSSAGTRSPHTTQEKSSKSSSSSSENTSSAKNNTSTTSPKPLSSHQPSPIIRNGLDVLQGTDLPKFGGFAYPPYPPFLAHHANLGYPFPSLYSRLKPGEGMSVCKDPYCNGCQSSSPASSSAFMAAAAAAAAAAGSGAAALICPAGCAQCDHQKFPMIPPGAPGVAGHPGFPAFPPSALGYPPSLLSHPHAAAAAAMMQNAAAQASAQQTAQQKPYVCNWNADSYCGKRFSSSDELLQHLRTHTSSAVAAASSAAPSSASVAPPSSVESAAFPGLHPPSSLYSSAMLNPSAMAMAAAAMHRTYPTPPLSPHRYNPYALAAAAAAAGAKPPGPLAPPQALAGYYSPYSLYGPRIG